MSVKSSYAGVSLTTALDALFIPAKTTCDIGSTSYSTAAAQYGADEASFDSSL